MNEHLKRKFNNNYDAEIDLIAMSIKSGFMDNIDEDMLKNIREFPLEAKLLLNMDFTRAINEKFFSSHDVNDNVRVNQISKLKFLKEKVVLKNIDEFYQEVMLVIKILCSRKTSDLYADHSSNLSSQLPIIRERSVLENVRKFPQEAEFILYNHNISNDLLKDEDSIINILSTCYPNSSEEELQSIKDNFEILKLLQNNILISDGLNGGIGTEDLTKDPIDVLISKNRDFKKLNKEEQEKMFPIIVDVCKKVETLKDLGVINRFRFVTDLLPEDEVLNHSVVQLDNVEKLQEQLSFLEEKSCYKNLIRSARIISKRRDEMDSPVKSLTGTSLQAVEKMLAM